jgi:hypothetical protein
LRNRAAMPQLTFPIPADELRLNVVLGHNRKALKAILAAGQSIPKPLWASAVIDTGSNITCANSTVLQQLGLSLFGQSASQTVGGMRAVNLFEISLSTPPPGNVAGPMLTRSDLIVMELPVPIAGVDVLIGMDLLLNYKLMVDGPVRQFALDF